MELPCFETIHTRTGKQTQTYSKHTSVANDQSIVGEVILTGVGKIFLFTQTSNAFGGTLVEIIFSFTLVAIPQ